ncbi:MAG TPA: SDR family oxidoreductase [Terracidiphilus sp.]|nr:SDR family oxidoreductase [Terracidiphilus sp.]
METLTLSGKSALVTGGARRIGRQIALTLARAGADVTLTFLSSAAEAAETVHMLEDLGRRAFTIPCDVRSEESVRHAVASSVAFHGHLDLLVNNAGVFQSASLESMSLEQWDAIFQTNARGPFLVSREALPHLRERRGRIVHLGSLGGLRAWPNHAHYCASKAALHMLTQAMAKAFAPQVTVNCVAPGWIQLDDDPGTAAARFAAKTPLGRNGSAEEVAEAVLFFAAGPAFITGQILCVDGGLGL